MTSDASPPFGGAVLLADKSAWERSDHPDIVDDWAAALSRRQIVTCPITAMELLYSTQTSVDFEEFEGELSVLRSVPITTSVINAARTAFRELAAHSDKYHRVPLPDLIVAACAQDAALDVLHYDGHFDRLATVLNFGSVWLAPAGSLD